METEEENNNPEEGISQLTLKAFKDLRCFLRINQDRRRVQLPSEMVGL